MAREKGEYGDWKLGGVQTNWRLKGRFPENQGDQRQCCASHTYPQQRMATPSSCGYIKTIAMRGIKATSS